MFCVITVCHQVRCTCWGHLGLFHRAIAHLKWYQMVWMGDLAGKFSAIKSTNMFSMHLQLGVPRYIIWRFIVVLTWNLTVFMFVYVNVDPLTLATTWRNMWLCDIFMLCPPGKIYLGVILLHACAAFQEMLIISLRGETNPYLTSIHVWYMGIYRNLTHPIIHLFHIPQYTIQNRNVHISVLNGALWDIRNL